MAAADTIHPAALPPDVLLKQCLTQRTRAAGPGGQHRNKVETAVHLTHHPTGVTAHAGERRSQAQNHKAALFRLRVKLALAVRLDYPAAGPTDRWRERVKDNRLAINPRHDDFPALLAEALDAIAATHFDVAKASRLQGISTSQMLKLLRHEPAALAQVNAARRERSLPALK